MFEAASLHWLGKVGGGYCGKEVEKVLNIIFN